MRNIYRLAILLAALLLPVGAGAAEVRCGELGSACICSEPFNTPTLVTQMTEYKNPADSTVKECATRGALSGAFQGTALESNVVSKMISRNDASMLAALPAGHSLSWAVGGTDNHLGIYFAGHTHASSTFTKRLAARFYIYHSPSFQFAQDGSCTNSKFMQFSGPNSLLDKSFGSVHMYNFLSSDNWSPGQDCCFNGPGPDQMALNKAAWRGKWWRAEAIYTNRAGPDWSMKLYMKNVTDNGPEYTVVDTKASGTQFNSAANWSPPGRQDNMLINNYRETSCTGFLAFSHYMMAGWDTDTGQRIGAASEVEGGGGGGSTTIKAPFRVSP